MLASYNMLRGFLNAMDAQNIDCANYFICEAASESAKLGQFGQVMAKVASSNAQAWLSNISLELFNGTTQAGLHGIGKKSCFDKFPCYKTAKSYKKPILLP